MLKTTDEHWRNATANLNARRKEQGHSNDNFLCDTPVADYRAHLDKCYVGPTLLDVGCGGQHLKSCCPEYVEYFGMDAFPIVPTDYVMAIEEATPERIGRTFNTVCAFAILDNCRDFDQAIRAMQSLATVNIIILTGIGIEPDKFHTMKLELSDYDNLFTGWANSVRKEIQSKVWLLEYSRI